jgi:apolipoprotein N-acyltransferase
VWPEVGLGFGCLDFAEDYVPQEWQGQPKQAIAAMLRKTLGENRQPLVDLAAEAGTSLLLNLKVTSYGQVEGRPSVTDYNSALLVDPQGNVGPRHDKIVLVPGFESAPTLKSLLGGCASCKGFTPGDRMVAFPLRGRESRDDGGLWAAVNLCYEGYFPDFLRRQVRTLAAEGRSPDVLINMTNVASFDLSGVAEMNLGVHVFRAVENRRPYLTATHAGYAAWIEPTGRIVERGERGAATYVVAEIGRERTESLYTYWGDWLPFGCVCLTALISVLCLLRRGPQRGSHGVMDQAVKGRGKGAKVSGGLTEPEWVAVAPNPRLARP